jgi:uncharacterized lipoprotein NlpE involved in copper resistance
MKKNILTIVAIAISLSFMACNQTNNKGVPQKVKDAFTEKFNEAKSIKWDKEDENEWEAEFVLNGKEMSANFDVDGNWKETEMEIEKEDIPEAVMNTFNKKFAGYDIEEAANVSTTKLDNCYEMDIEKGDAKMEVLFDANGNLLKKEVDDEGDEQGEQNNEVEENDSDQQETTQVPELVEMAFGKRFVNATDVEWGMEDETEWEAEFKMNAKDYSANFDNNGNWKETEYEINIADIPMEVKSALDKSFEGYKIEEAEISETANGKVYEFELEKGESNIEVAISPNGKVIDKEESAENSDEDND